MKVYQHPDNTSRIDVIKSWLHKPMRVTVTDGRIFVGEFICFDKNKNIMLANCYEYTRLKDSKKEERKFQGLVMINGNTLKSCWVETDLQK